MSIMRSPIDQKIAHIYDHTYRRCYCETDPNYKNFGAKGIRMCTEWYNTNDKKQCVRNFIAWAHEAGFEPGMVITRRDLTKDFSPENCYWLPRKDMRRHSDKEITVDNKTYSFADLDRMNPNDPYRARDKKDRGWSNEAIVYAALHPEESLRKTETLDGITYRDKDNFVVLIPRSK